MMNVDNDYDKGVEGHRPGGGFSIQGTEAEREKPCLFISKQQGLS